LRLDPWELFIDVGQKVIEFLETQLFLASCFYFQRSMLKGYCGMVHVQFFIKF